MRKLLALLVVVIAAAYFLLFPEDFAQELPYDGLTLSTEVAVPPPPPPAGLDLTPEQLLPPARETREPVTAESGEPLTALGDSPAGGFDDLDQLGELGELVAGLEDASIDEDVPVALPGDLAPVATEGTPISGRVVDPAGNGIPGVRVRVEHAYLPEVQSSTDPSGTFRMTPAEPRGTLTLATSAWVLLGGDLSLRDGQTAEYLLVVAEPVFLRGVVVDEAGVRIDGARVHGFAPSDALVPFGMPSLPMDHEAQHGYTNARGEFRIGPVPLMAGTELEVQHDGYPALRQGLPEDPRQPLTVVLSGY